MNRWIVTGAFFAGVALMASAVAVPWVMVIIASMASLLN